MASGTLWTGGTQSFRPPRYPEDWRDSVDWRDSFLSATRYPVDRRDSVRLATRYAVDWHSILSGPRYPLDWRDSVLLAHQVPWGLVGLSPFSPPGTLWTGGTQSSWPSRNLGTRRRGRNCLSRNMLCVYVPWQPSSGGLVPAKREKRGLVLLLAFISIFFFLIQWNVLNIILYVRLEHCCILVRFFCWK